MSYWSCHYIQKKNCKKSEQSTRRPHLNCKSYYKKDHGQRSTLFWCLLRIPRSELSKFFLPQLSDLLDPPTYHTPSLRAILPLTAPLQTILPSADLKWFKPCVNFGNSIILLFSPIIHPKVIFQKHYS